jgi:hypothetical protein
VEKTRHNAAVTQTMTWKLLSPFKRHPSESWGPAYFLIPHEGSGMPAFAGMTAVGSDGK